MNAKKRKVRHEKALLLSDLCGSLYTLRYHFTRSVHNHPEYYKLNKICY